MDCSTRFSKKKAFFPAAGLLVAACVAPPSSGLGGAGGASGKRGTTTGTGGAAAGAAGTGGATSGTGGSVAGTTGKGGGATAGAGGSAAGATGTGGSGGYCVDSPPTQATFGGIGQGDSNPNFQSGVGALGTNAMYIFSGYTSATGDGGVGSQEIYGQAFEPRTGASKGAAQPLFAPPTLGFESASYVGGTVDLFAAAVASTGSIALVYQLTNQATSDTALYAAFLSPSASGDGRVEGIQLQHVELVSTNFLARSYRPKVFWSNASQTFVVNYSIPSAAQLSMTNTPQMSLNKYTATGQSAGAIGRVPLYEFMGSVYHRDLTTGAVGESGNLLGALYVGGLDTPNSVSLTALDEGGNVVGAPLSLRPPGAALTTWAAIAGTAKGFVCSYFGLQYINVVWVPASGGTVGPPGPNGWSLMSLPRAGDGLAIADDVGTGGKGGVGLAFALGTDGVAFAYVNADATVLQGPSWAFATGGMTGAMSLTNFNGSFAVSIYTAAAHAAQVVATGFCP